MGLVHCQGEVLPFPTGHVVRGPGQLRPAGQLVAWNFGDPDAERCVDGVDFHVRGPVVERVVDGAGPRQLDAKPPARGDACDLAPVGPDERRLLRLPPRVTAAPRPNAIGGSPGPVRPARLALLRALPPHHGTPPTP